MYVSEKNVAVRDSAWQERGFVVRVFKDGLFSEYSLFSQYSAVLSLRFAIVLPYNIKVDITIKNSCSGVRSSHCLGITPHLVVAVTEDNHQQQEEE